MFSLNFYKLHPDVKLPEFQTEEAACFDLSFSNAGIYDYVGYDSFNMEFVRPLERGNIIIYPKERIKIPTGLIMNIPRGYSVRIHCRGSTATKRGLVLANLEGVVDSDYVDQVFIPILNISDEIQTIINGERLAQAELVRVEEYLLKETLVKPSKRGNRIGGFGSTGVA